MTPGDELKAPLASRPPVGSDASVANDRNRDNVVANEGLSGIEFSFIDEALEESMIASDPVALTPETSIGPPDHGHGHPFGRG